MSGKRAAWPVARRYRDRDRLRISLPVGGIGTGTVGFGGRGQFRDWEIENRPAKGLNAPLTFLACRVSGERAGTHARVLEGDLFDEEVEGALGSPAGMAGLPRFSDCDYETSYPFGRVALSDPTFPLRVSVEAFNPLWPGDPDLSGLPMVSLRVVLDNPTAEVLDASVMLSVEDLVGHALRSAFQPTRPVATPRSEDGAQGYLLGDEAIGGDDEAAGTLAAAVLGSDTWLGPTWNVGKWNQGLLNVWRSFVADGTLAPGQAEPISGHVVSAVSGREQTIAATMGATRTVAAGGSAEVEFLLTWHFPNRRAWFWSGPGPAGGSGPDIVGNAYAVELDDAWSVVRRESGRVNELRNKTETFVSAFWRSDLDDGVKEAALFNISTLRSGTFFRTADGLPFGWEGCLDTTGSCLGSCTHVWNYDLTTPFLFAGLARQMRELEYEYGTGPDGAMSFRIMLPLSRARQMGTAAADGQFGCVVKLFREWRLSGDDEWLRRLWPACRRSIEFAWIEGGWDGDGDGLAEGAQHNTMDVEYYGPNPVVQTWYLAALKSAVAMAEAVGDTEFAARCADLLAGGAAATEAQLFNGEYYFQKVVPPKDFSLIAPQLRHPTMGAEQAENPEFQIGDGCIIDQLVGDIYGRVAGLDAILDPARASTALESIHRYNYVADLGDWSNTMRTYGIRGERGHLVEAYPGGIPEHPMPYWSEVWTGLEYVYATGLVQDGQTELATDVVRSVRERYAGNRRNPFDEEECGHHYARSMASWGVLVALTGFHYDAHVGELTFAASEHSSQWFWSTGEAWGTISQRVDDAGTRSVQLEVIAGPVRVERITIGSTMYRPSAPGSLDGPSTWELQPA